MEILGIAEKIAVPVGRRLSMHLRFWLNSCFGLLAALMLPLAAILSYAVFWSVWYRLPAAAPKFVDWRADKRVPGIYVIFCSGLADNPVGFPGHCYVSVSRDKLMKLEESNTFGYCPCFPKDQIPSLWQAVPGALCANACKGNMRNLDELIVEVDSNKLSKIEDCCRAWRYGTFRVGVSDCVRFCHATALAMGLKTVKPDYIFPQDFIRELKKIN